MPVISGGGGGGTTPTNRLQLRGPFQVLESDVEVTLWTPAIGDVIVNIWLTVDVTFTNAGAKIEVYTDTTDLFFAGVTNALAANPASQDASRRWPLADWRASTNGPESVPTTMRTASPVLADVIGSGPGAGVAQVYALTASP